jgi:tRNA 2-thiouridine synthesizing protein A
VWPRAFGAREWSGFAPRRGRIVGGKKMNFDKELDARGLNCPLPILKSKKSLNDMASGQVLKVVSTDPGSVKDMEAFCKQTKNDLLSSAEENKCYVFYVKKR